MIPDPDQCCQYRIVEGTKDEVLGVARAVPPYVVRWADDRVPDQRWILVPVDDDIGHFCRIVNAENGEYMALGDDGYLVRWERKEEKTQLFRFANHKDGWWNILCGDKDYLTIHLAAVGPATLNLQPLLRKDDDLKYQRFKLNPVDKKAKPQLIPGNYEPGQIPEIPRLQDFEHHPPMQSASYLIAETCIPAVLVHDPGYPDIVVRVQQSPYYILRREQYWDRTRCTAQDPCLYEHDGHTTKHYKTVITYGYSEQHSRTMEDKLGLKMSADATIVLTPRVKTTIGLTLTKELRLQESAASEYHSSVEYTAELDIPAEHFLVCNWVLVNAYTLYRMDRGAPVDSWQVVQSGEMISDGYPRPLPATTKIVGRASRR